MRPGPVANEEGRRGVLRRFGYQASDKPAPIADPQAAWDLLRADFASREEGPLPLDQLHPDVRESALAYIEQRARLDRLMDACDAAHLRILEEGPQPALVEAYASDRDAYEDAVEDFGALRVRVQAALDILRFG
ncbi:MAG: hypothetical protein EPO51_02925 [Phenylobacterium sp.]|uniref:hypothetical protein n=1 Tax=Phenylobacterium sp. TaxID=1871053 RepID=UPI001226EDD9|nr:hypothetical protein [Phenylobacterium sp.]TAJ74067.1 MAG: hypothetical protein EPO51_02925 [Phenylobacterium sp.]